MTLITDLRHYVSTWPYRETKDYKVWEKYFKDLKECEILKIEWEYMLMQFDYWKFCVSKNYKFDKQK